MTSTTSDGAARRVFEQDMRWASPDETCKIRPMNLAVCSAMLSRHEKIHDGPRHARAT